MEYPLSAALAVPVVGVITLGLSLMLLWTGLEKAGQRWSFVATIRTWRLLPDRGARVTGFWLPRAEVALGLLGLGGLTRAHYVRVSLNGHPIFLMSVEPLAGGVRWASTDIIQGGTAGLELDDVFRSRSANFGRAGLVGDGANEIIVSVVPSGSPELVVALLPGTRILGSQLPLPSGKAYGSVKFTDGGGFNVVAEAVHTGVPVAASEVVVLVAPGDGTLRRQALRFQGPIQHDSNMRAAFSGESERRPHAIFVQYDWGGGGTPPLQIWPVERRPWVEQRLGRPAPWTYIAALALLWVGLSNVRTRPSSKSFTSRSQGGNRHRILLATAILGISGCAFLIGTGLESNAHRDGSVAAPTAGLPTIVDGRAVESLLDEAMVNMGYDAWQISLVTVLTRKGESIGYFAKVAITEAPPRAPGDDPHGGYAQGSLDVGVDLNGRVLFVHEGS